MNNPICWFELPTADFERAIAFYESIFAIRLRRESGDGFPMALFPYAEPHAGGALVAMPHLAPRDNGTLVYLNGGDDLAAVLARIPAAGGKVTMAKTCIGEEIGHIALFIDCEGNRVGLFSRH
jgi:predicted enzyme related to lactoylglutathione lyase